MAISLTDLMNVHQGLELSFQAFADLMMVLDAHGRVLEFRGRESSPYAFSNAILGKNIADVFSPLEVKKIERALGHVEKTGSVATFEYSLSHANVEFWFDARLAPLSKSQFLLTARDITICRETESRLNRKMQQLSALRSLDLAIVSGLDLHLLLSMFLDQVSTLLHVDATALLLLNPKTNLLEFVSGKGFYSSALQHTRLRLGESLAGKVALERRLSHIPDLSQHKTEFIRSPYFAAERFVAYYGMPLIAKGTVLGVLEIFQRSPLNPDADWLNFLKMLAGQAAIAIDSATMFKELQISNLELNIAYDATIEGLSRALDLRDKETEEHTRRVTDIALKLADKLGVQDSERIHVRRGAILHDIGKVAIPDQILFKPGPLIEEEWKIMRRHPDIAVQLLSPVTYLAPALDIPHWHHERWDGTGYPDRLRGDAIPFTARLFAFADVYDALTSNRPYRSAWRKQEALEYIREQSGKHFDPGIVPVFMELVSTKSID
jgi:putative nucleotidyltransferase with HDIG domain